MTMPVSDPAVAGDAVEAAADDALAAFIQEHGDSAAPAKAGKAGKQEAAAEAAADDAAPTEGEGDTAEAAAAAAAASTTEGDEEEGDEEGADTGDESGLPALPEGYISVAPVADGLATDFVIRDAEGGELEVPALHVEYKANGKVRKDRIDQVVKLAQFGVYNQEREQALVAREAQAKAAAEPLRERLTLREQQLQQLLEDPDIYEAARERYMADNTPERQVERLRDEVRRKDEEAAAREQAHGAQSFLQNDIMPSLEVIAEALPEVEWDELMNRMAVHMLPMMKNGVVPPAQYDAIRQYILTDLTPWAQKTHETRAGRLSAAKSDADKKTREAQVSSQRVKSEVGRAIKPVGRPAPDGKGSKPAPKGGIVSIDDAMASAEAAVLEGLSRG